MKTTPAKIPSHVAIIPDGNRRWAQERGLPTYKGHQQGYKQMQALAREAQELGINTMTIWGFSTENWDRQESEREYLFKIFMRMLRVLAREARQRNIRIKHLGRQDRLPAMVINYLKKLEESTQLHQQFQLNIALDYGGRDEILRATRKMLEQGIDPSLITEEVFSQFLDTGGSPDPDLIIRTSGEQRISGLLPWQGAYAEYYFSPLHLPDFGPAELREAIEDYSRRERRFGR